MLFGAVLSVLSAGPAWAQLGDNASGVEGDAMQLAARDGRLQGRTDGSRLGHEQTELKALVDAFKKALASVPSSRADFFRERAVERGRGDGEKLGSARGQREGGAAAAEAHASGSKASDVAVPDPPETNPRLPADLDACRPPGIVEFELSTARVVEVDLGKLPDGGLPLDFAVPDPPRPPFTSTRNTARDKGYTGANVDDFVTYYNRKFDDAYREAYWEAREQMSAQKLAIATELGHQAGLLEGERRLACSVMAEAYREAHVTAHDAAYRAAYREAWQQSAEQHASGAAIHVSDGSLADGGGDGLLEPGEAVRLRITMTNHGQGGSASAGRWEGVRGIEGSGDLGPAPGPGASREAVVDLGSVNAEARVRSSIVVKVEPTGGHPTHVTGRVGRPASFELGKPELTARDGHPVAVATATVRSEVERPLEGLAVVAGDERHALPALDPGASRSVEVALPVTGDRLARGAAVGEVTVAGPDGETWLAQSVELELSTAQLVAAAGRIGGTGPVTEALKIRLAEDWSQVVADPARLSEGGGSELRRYASALRALPSSQRGPIQREVSAHVLGLAESADVPRKIRKTIKKLLANAT